MRQQNKRIEVALTNTSHLIHVILLHLPKHQLNLNLSFTPFLFLIFFHEAKLLQLSQVNNDLLITMATLTNRNRVLKIQVACRSHASTRGFPRSQWPTSTHRRFPEQLVLLRKNTTDLSHTWWKNSDCLHSLHVCWLEMWWKKQTCQRKIRKWISRQLMPSDKQANAKAAWKQARSAADRQDKGSCVCVCVISLLNPLTSLSPPTAHARQWRENLGANDGAPLPCQPEAVLFYKKPVVILHNSSHFGFSTLLLETKELRYRSRFKEARPIAATTMPAALASAAVSSPQEW